MISSLELAHQIIMIVGGKYIYFIQEGFQLLSFELPSLICICVSLAFYDCCFCLGYMY